MSPHDPPIQSYDDLLALFHEAEKEPPAYRIGPEMEKFGVYEGSLAPIPYAGDKGVLRFFDHLKTLGWVPEAESDGGPVIALQRRTPTGGVSSITLEPGGQFELSGSAVENVHQVCAEFREHITELAPVSKELGIRWLGLGFHPTARREDFSWVPKGRYGIMRTYLPTRGGHALDMMLRTSTVQANYDYSNEADAMRKLRIGLKLSPLTTAMFANSPWCEGKPHGGVTYRGRVWLDVDPDRTGLLPAMWREGARYADYVEWALDVPMFLVKRGDKKLANTGQTFRSFWKDGFEGHRPTFGDWQTHLNTLFPEVRLKKTLEIRGADAQGAPTRCALPALWTGIYYDARALDEAEALVADWTHDEVAALRPDAWRLGLRATFRGRPLADVAARLMEIAEGGLTRRNRLDSKGRNETVHLARLKELVAAGMCPADKLLEGIDQEPDFARAVLARATLD